MRSLEEKIRTARQALIRASLTEKFDEDTVRAKALEVGKLDAELAVLRAKTMSKVQPPLSEKQIERVLNPPPHYMDGSGPGPHDLPVAPKPESQ